MTALVIAYGNPLRGDDGIGPRVAAELSGVDVLVTHQLQPELADRLREADRVVFIDATVEGTAGDVRCTRIEPRTADANLTHSVEPATLLMYAATLYGARPAGVQVTVCGERFDFGDGLSSAVEAAIPAVRALVLAECAKR